MSTATRVPETRGLDGDDARETLRSAEMSSVLRDAFLRFRYADGFSYARSMGFQLVLTLIPGMIFVVALAVRMGQGTFQRLLRSLIESLAPGPAGEIFLRAFSQGAQTTGNEIAIVVGGLAALVSAVTAMAQLQRGASRIYGVQADRPTVARYGTATLLTLSVGVLLTVAFMLTVLGSSIGQTLSEGVANFWGSFRFPVAFIVLAGAFAVLFKFAPNRQQPAVPWLVTGGVISVLGWFVVSASLAWYINASSTFGETYGPLAGFVGVMLWSQLSAIAILFGLSFAAQLEAVRAGVDEPVEQPAEDKSDSDSEISDGRTLVSA